MSSRLTRDDARALGLEILRRKPDPAVRVRLLRDVLCVDREDPRLREARRALEDSAHVRSLSASQRVDGSWGRLHSRDTSVAQTVPTTEWAVERALAIGLEASHPILAGAAAHLAAVVAGRAEPPDPPERNDRWRVGVCLFAAATLARVAPLDPCLDAVWQLWDEIARRSFPEGAYDAAAEADAHRALTGASVEGSYLTLGNRYTLALLSARADKMQPELRHALVNWIGRRDEGVGYYGLALAAPPADTTPGALERFLLSHETVARFGETAAPTGPLADWLDARRRPDGLWDLGARAPWTAALPLSESWRRGDARATDWTVRTLALLGHWLYAAAGTSRPPGDVGMLAPGMG